MSGFNLCEQNVFRLGEEDVLALGDEDVWLSRLISWVNLTSKTLISHF